MTDEEEASFLQQSPMALIENMSEEDFEAVHKVTRKMTTPEFKKIREAKNVQMEKDLQRKEEQVKEQETREAKALQRYKDKENFEVFETFSALQEKLKEVHQSGLPMYTPAMKCDIVTAQLQYRRDCLARFNQTSKDAPVSIFQCSHPPLDHSLCQDACAQVPCAQILKDRPPIS